MSLFNENKKVSVEEVKGGWLLDWSAPGLEEDPYLASITVPQKRVKTNGREIFTDKKKLIKRLQDFI